MSLSTAGVSALLNVMSSTQFYLQLHLGSPGPGGVLNVATVGRQPVHFSAPTAVRPQHITSDGTTSADGAAVNFGTWIGSVFPSADFITHWSLWDAATSGTYWGRGCFGGLQPKVALVSGAVFTTANAHSFVAGDTIEVLPILEDALVAPFASDTLYAVTTAGLAATTLSLSTTDASGTAVVASADAACVVQKIVPILTNTDDPVLISNGEVVLYLE